MFEQMITHTCNVLKMHRLAAIQKTPEPIRIIDGKNRSKGVFKAVFETKAQPDFTGTLKGGQSIMFEAKFTSATRLAFRQVNPVQRETLRLHHELGAVAFILIGFGMKDVYAIPIADWIHMEETIEKKSINQTDIGDYRISTENGHYQFLDRFT